MAKKEAEVEESLSEEQRIAQLEKKVGAGKIVLMSVALLLIIIISVSVTALVLFVTKGENLEEQVVLFETTIANQKALIADQDAKILELEKKIPDITNQLSNSSNGMILRLLDEQESSNQLFLESAKTGIYDLANMVPGSRTWLALYQEQLDTAIEMSQTRQATIKQLRKGAPIVEKATKASKSKEDSFFDDF